MTYRKTPANLAAVKKEADAISRALLTAGDDEAEHTDIAAVFDLIRAAEAHLEEVKTGYYENELELAHLDLAAAYASLAKAGARAAAVRMDIANPPEM
ncbi:MULTISPECIES: hypothetical protein [unclassified Streptomyces]|uniref:hypothetical protein n=1 Tax=unclassified Streptomyces TaxID=2593676 RepID=UPI0040423B8A